MGRNLFSNFFNKNSDKLVKQSLSINELFYYNLLKNKEKTLNNNSNIANKLFLEIAKSYLVKVEEAYKELPQFISKVLKDTYSTISNEEQEIFSSLKKNVLEVKLFLFQNIENNIEEFKLFENSLKPYLSGDKEYDAKLLALSFYNFKFSDKNYTLENLSKKNIEILINEMKPIIDSGEFITFLPNDNELKILKETTQDIRFNTGLEYEFLLDKDFLKDLENKSTINERILLESIIDSLFNSNKDSENISKYSNSKIAIENVKEYKEGMKFNYLEIVSKKFNSLSEMLIFNETILNTIKLIKAKSKESIIYPNNNSKGKEEQTFDRLNGSVHINISIPNIENLNTIKFLLFVKDNELFKDWEIRGKMVKDLSMAIDIFGPLVLECFDFDKYWQINFTYLKEIDKNGELSPRVEIRYIGGKDYELKGDLINENIINLLNYVKIATSNEENELYISLLKKYDIDRKWNELEDYEQDFCMILFKTNDPDIVIKQFDKLKETIVQLKIIKEEIGER